MNTSVATESEQKVRTRILIVTGVLWVGGGAEKVVATLGNMLTDRGYEAHVLTLYNTAEEYECRAIRHSFNEPFRHNRISKLWRVPQRIWRIYRYARTHRIEVIVSFLEEANFYVLLSKLCFRLRTSVIVSVRNNVRSRDWLFRIASRLLYPFAQKVVCVTRGIEQMCLDDFGLRNTTTIYNMIDMDVVGAQISQGLPEQYAGLSGQPLFVHVGRHHSQKGQWHLLRAFQSVSEVLPNAQLVMLGDGEDRWKLERFMRETNFGERVTLVGNQRNIFPFLHIADCSVFSSLYEGMPNAVLEALAAGTPIVTPDCETGPREILAPELSLDETPHYPYHTPYGTLTRPLSPRECWSSITDVPLDHAEQELATALVDTVRATYDPALVRRRVADFASDETIREWEDVIASALRLSPP